MVFENLEGAVIGTLSAIDEDAGQTLQFATSDPRFRVTGTALSLKPGQFLTADSGAITRVQVTVTDSGLPPRSLSQFLEIQAQLDPFPWQLATDAMDVNGDGHIAPIDVLVIINELNTPAVALAHGRLPVSRPTGTPSLPYYDINGDGFVTAMDALLVINYLNDATSGEGERSELAETPRICHPATKRRSIWARNEEWTDGTDTELDDLLAQLARDRH